MIWTPAALLRPSGVSAVRDAAAWADVLAAREHEDPFSLAVSGGRRAGTVGWAFCCGYQAALRALLPDHTGGRLAALCATEAAGNHPRSIQTTLRDGTLTGEKSFVTLGPLAELLVVIATAGRDGSGRNRLVACVVEPTAAGVELTAMPPLPFVPEVPHGTLRLVEARPRAILPGDGYTEVLKPFRTVEDIHVHAALAAWMVGVAVDADWPAELVEALLSGIASLAQASQLDPSSTGTHRLLGGTLAAFEAIVARAEPLWAAGPPELASMWARDRPLLGIAGAARRARLARARAQQPGGGSPTGRPDGGK